MELFRFEGDPCKWPGYIQNFKNRVHDKRGFTDDIRMERLLSVLDGEVKQTVMSIGRNGLFYATAMKTLKRNFGNPMVVSFFKTKISFRSSSDDKRKSGRFKSIPSTTNVCNNVVKLNG